MDWTFVVMESVREINQLDLKTCYEMCFRFADFLEATGITKISFEKTKSSDLFNYGGY